MRLKTRLTSMAQERGPAKPPPPLLSEMVQGMPRGEMQQIRVLVPARARHGQGRSGDRRTASRENDRYNRGTDPMRVVIFYVIDADTPFLDVARH